MQRWLPSWAILLACLSLSLSCATTPKEEGVTLPAVPVRTHFVLREQPVQKFREPLPALKVVDKEWHYSDGRVEVVPGFRLWDFNGDGSPDYVEKLNENGDIETAASDFNYDGSPDLAHNSGGETGAVKPAVASPSVHSIEAPYVPPARPSFEEK